MQPLIYFDIKENDERAPNRLLIQFPPIPTLREDFKKKFRGECEWVQKSRAWSVPIESRTRLEEWTNLTRALAPLAREATNIYFTKEEIEETKVAVEAAKVKHAALVKESGGLTLLRNVLHNSALALREHVAEISALEASKAFTRQQIEASKAEISATCLRLGVDLPVLYKAYDAMKHLEASSSRADVEEWRKYHRLFIDARNAFSDAGLDFHAATFGAESKEKIANMPELAWFTITKL